MAVGDAVIGQDEVSGSGTLTIRPAAGVQWRIDTITCTGGCNVRLTNGTDYPDVCKNYTEVAIEGPFFITNDLYLSVLDTGGYTNQISYDGVVIAESPVPGAVGTVVGATATYGAGTQTLQPAAGEEWLITAIGGIGVISVTRKKSGEDDVGISYINTDAFQKYPPLRVTNANYVVLGLLDDDSGYSGIITKAAS